MKSQHSNFHVGPSDEDEDGDEDEEFDNLDLEFGCKPEEVMMSAVELLDDEDREEVRRLDFGAFFGTKDGNDFSTTSYWVVCQKSSYRRGENCNTHTERCDFVHHI